MHTTPIEKNRYNIRAIQYGKDAVEEAERIKEQMDEELAAHRGAKANQFRDSDLRDY